MGMVKIRPPPPHKIQTLNWLPRYEKTLHNWLRPWDKLVAQIWYKSAVRERLAKYMKYKASFYYYFFLGLAYWSDPSADFDAQSLKLRGITQGCAFLKSARWPTTFRGSKSQKNQQKGCVVRQSKPSRRNMKFLYLQNWVIYSNET